MKGFLLSIGALLVGLLALLAVFWRRATTFFQRKDDTPIIASASNHEAAVARREARREKLDQIKREREETIKCEATKARDRIKGKFGDGK